MTALYQGRGGELWIGTQVGLHRYETGKLVWFVGKDKLALPDVRAITESADGTLWFGMSGGGLGSLQEGVLKQFRQRDGLSSDLVSCLYADPDGTLWIGTTDNGLTRRAQGMFSIISTAQGLPSKIICHIVDDDVGNLWMGSQNGILRVSKADLHRCADGQDSTVHCLSYGRAEGLAAQTCSGGFGPGACKTADGRLWFPTVKGLAIVDPMTTNSVAPPVVIEALLVDGSATNNWISGIPGVSAGSSASRIQLLPNPALERTEIVAPGIAKPLRIPPGHRRFEFHYTGLSFVAPDKVRFRCRLEGLEHDWVDAGIKRVAEYSYLPPGSYTFKVIACNNDDVWNEAGASVTFTVLAYFWQTLWFRAASMVAGAGVLAGGILWVARWRLRRKLEQSERERALERERTRIARDIHDDLGASLTRISMLSQSVRSEVEDLPQAAADVDQIHSTAREITRALDEIVWAVNPKYDTLDSLVAYLGRFAQLYLSATAIRCRLHVPVDPPPLALTAEVRHNVFLAFKEALHNAVKHAHATEVSVSLELRPTEFELLVVDNGRGFNWKSDASTAVTSGDGLRSAPGNGLLNMQKRMEEIGGRCEWDIVLGEGTRVKFTVMFKS
ncbi:MAG: two-component regulator propeller domain-containing protein [Verrucomicrobiota bacterium]